MDESLQLVAILFILSMICERISNFFKINLSDSKDNWKLGFGNMINKSSDESLEKLREYRILKINIFFGFVTAASLNASLISIINKINDPSSAIGWSQFDLSSGWGLITYPIGWLMTGLFISLGSKFWHDLLDLLLQVKNLRRKLTDERPYENLDSIEQFKAFLATPESKMADMAYAKYKEEISKIDGVVSVGKGYLKTPKGKIGCIEVHVTNKFNKSNIKDAYTIELKSEVPGMNALPIEVPVNIIEVSNYPQTHSLSAGAQIANQSKKLGWGTLGAVVFDKVTGVKYILSCFHVLNGSSSWRELSSSKKIINQQEEQIAELVYGLRTPEFDTAIASVNDGVEVNNSAINNPKSIKPVTSSDAINEIIVNITGATTGKEVSGYVYNHSWDTYFQYPDGKLFELKDLLAITSNQNRKYTSITQQGDSGALVRDAENNVIGMVVGGNDSFTYAIKMSKIENVFDIKF